MTRSLNEPRQSAAGFAQWSVGSIDADGMRYGFAISASKARTNAIATVIVTAQSRIVRHGCGSRLVVRARERIAGRKLAAGRRERRRLTPGHAGPPDRPRR